MRVSLSDHFRYLIEGPNLTTDQNGEILIIYYKEQRYAETEKSSVRNKSFRPNAARKFLSETEVTFRIFSENYVNNYCTKVENSVTVHTDGYI